VFDTHRGAGANGQVVYPDDYANLDVRGKVAIGNTHQDVNINGSQNVTFADGTTFTVEPQVDRFYITAFAGVPDGSEIVTLTWALLFPRPAWFGFFAMMFVLAVPRLLMAVPGDPGAPPEHQYPRLLLGWLSGNDFPAWFWIKNTGLFWPLLLVALLSPLALKGRARLLLAPFVLVFLAGNLVKFQPWDWDNTKVLVFWYLGSAVAVGAVLVRLWRAGIAGATASALVWLTLVASGVLSMLQFLPPQGPSYVWFSAEEVRLAETIRTATPPRSVFVTG